MATIGAKIKARLESAFRWMEQSYLFKISIFILFTWLICSFIYAFAEKDSVFNAMFYILVLIFGEVSIDPQTIVGRITALIILILGIMLFAVLIGEITNLLLGRLINRDLVKMKRFYSGSNHVVICGTTEKLKGALSELRSKDLERSSYSPIVIISENVDEIKITDSRLRWRVYGIKGDPLNEEILRKAGIERCKSILIFTKEGEIKGRQVYRDSYASMVYKGISNYLALKKNAKSVQRDINVVIEFMDESVNLLPCCQEDSHKAEVFRDPIGNTGYSLIVEPVFMEKLSTFMLVQSLLEKDIDEIVQRLLTTQIIGSNEFYYHTVGSKLAGKSFFAVEHALLKTNATPIGVLRKHGGKGPGKVNLLINPVEEVKLQKGDQIVMITYNERELRRAEEALNKVSGGLRAKPVPQLKSKRDYVLPFKKLVILNWDRSQVRDTLLELSKILINLRKNSKKGTFKKLKVTIATKHPLARLEKEYSRIISRIDKAVGGQLPELMDVELEQVVEPITLEELDRIGITAKNAEGTKVTILAEEYDEEEPDLMALYQSQLIENRVSNDIFTIVEINESVNLHLFNHSFIDVLVSVDDFCEKLLAQAVLKPHVSLIFRNLLTFSEDTNEFYIRSVPKKYVGRPIFELQEALIGYPVIFIGHIRPYSRNTARLTRQFGARSRITVNPRWDGEYEQVSIRYDRLKSSEKLQKGDRVVLIAREPRIVDAVLTGV